MDIVDRLLAHDVWTTRQLLLACKKLTFEKFDQPFDVDHKTLRETFAHIIENMEIWTDLLYQREVVWKQGKSIEELLSRLDTVSLEFSELTCRIVREKRSDETFIDKLDNPPREKTFGGAIGHVITHNMHHRAQIMYLMEKNGLTDHIEGDLLSWESQVHDWN